MKYLFIDDGEVEAIDNLARKLHQPEKFFANAVLRPENRWENCAIQIRTTPAWDPQERLFKMIYLASAEGLDPEVRLDPTGAPQGGESFYCYATSTDGVNWDKPHLGLHDYAAPTWTGKPIGRANNILPSAGGLLLGPYYDPYENDPARRFKGLAYRGGSLEPLVSADAQAWANPGLASLASADESHLVLDEGRRRYIATVKHGGPYGRSFYLTTSEDFEHWSDQELVFHADQVDQENGWERLQALMADPSQLQPVYFHPEDYRTDVYNFPVFPYEGLYLALPVMHHWTSRHPPMFENVDSRKSVELAASRDLRHWHRVADRRPFLEHSPQGRGEVYDTGQIVTTNGPIVRNRELWFYYVGLRHRSQTLAATRNREYLDGSAVCMARLRLDGFVSLKGGVEWGSVLTRPVTVTGAELHLNVDSWRGQVQVEVLDADTGLALPGRGRQDAVPTTIDGIDEVARWQQGIDLSAWRGRTVRLRFWLLRGELYAYWFADAGAR